MALTQEHRQIGDQLGELPVLAIGAGAEGVADVLDHKFGAVLDDGTGATGQKFCIVQRRRINGQRANP